MSDEYSAVTHGIGIVDGVSVDITVEGDEDRAEKVLMDLKERMGVLAAAYDRQTPPDELGELSAEYVPPMVVDWDGVFGGSDE